MKNESKKKSITKNDDIKLRNEDLYASSGILSQIRLEHLKDDLKHIRDEYDKRIDELPKEFKYYCRACLYQTNEESDVCPKCNEGKLIRSK